MCHLHKGQCVVSTQVSTQNNVSLPHRTMCRSCTGRCFVSTQDNVSFPQRTRVASNEDKISFPHGTICRLQTRQCVVSECDNLMLPKRLRRSLRTETFTPKPPCQNFHAEKRHQSGAERGRTNQKRSRTPQNDPRGLQNAAIFQKGAQTDLVSLLNCLVFLRVF